MKAILLTSILVLNCVSSVRAQHSPLKEVFTTLLYDERVSNRVFFEYEGLGNFTSVLPEGKYAFIYPDSVFTLLYPEIHYDLAKTWGSEKKLNTMTYLQGDSSTVFVSDNLDGNVKFYILFEEVRFLEKEAKIRFKTSCESRHNGTGVMHFFDVTLIYDHGWRIKEYDSYDVCGCKWKFLGRTVDGKSIPKK